MTMTMNRKLSMISVPFGLGAGRAGAEQGPESIVRSGLLRQLKQLGIEVAAEREVNLPSAAPAREQLDEVPVPARNAKHLAEVLYTCSALAEQVSAAVTDGCFPLVLGGDHSIAMGTLAGLTRHYRNVGVIWFDAHSDLNTEETSPSGNVHGMSLAVALGRAEFAEMPWSGPYVRADRVVLIGARDLDPGEKEFIRQQGITCFTMHEIDRMGMERVVQEALRIVGSGTDGVHLSFDVDSVDPYEAPGTGTPVQGGVSYREAHLAMELLHESGLVTSAEFVEVNPTLDVNNKTARLAKELIGSLFGQRIL
ncbi:arginase [Paenibacillus sp. MER TA 81-3]|uniref:arginase n=1 Tax=Paenibacillus sp. MER TA 81-3 TaxID=2939573 RepID=UPI00203E34D8|nr:arginase [Paenibacillus sp. MER TA 81-3]MCM3338647.1 arginase [Paenibacillus sp. MER TA 81-3]